MSQTSSIPLHLEYTFLERLGYHLPLKTMGEETFTDHENQKTVQELYCSAEIATGIHNELIALSGLNILFAITAFVGNALILVALQKENSLHLPSKHLLRSLATTDLCVGFIVEPLEVIFWMCLVNDRWDMCRFVLTVDTVASYTLCTASLLTLTVISLDRLFALSFRLRYRQVVTMRRAYTAVRVIWIASIFVSTIYLWKPFIAEWCGYIIVPLCLLTSTFSYSKIFVTLRHHTQELHPRGQPSQATPLNVERYKKAVNSALWLQLTLVICYLPYSIARALLSKRGLSSTGFIAKEFALTLLYVNSTLNPFLYCWKIREVRQAVKDTIRQLFCSLHRVNRYTLNVMAVRKRSSNT